MPKLTYSKNRKGLLEIGLSVGLIGLLLGGCASPTRVHAPLVSLQQVGEAETVIGLRQQEIGTTINRQNSSAIYGQFGLIGGLIGGAIDAGVNNSRGKKAENAVTTLRDELLDYPPADVLATTLGAQLATDPARAPMALAVRQITSADEPRQWLAACPVEQLLIIDFDYDLTPNYDGVHVSAAVALLAKDGRGEKTKWAKLPPALYYNVVSSVRRFATLEGDTLEAKAEALLVDDARVVREALDAAQVELAQLIAYDLDRPTRPENSMYKRPADSDAPRRTLLINQFTPLMIQGYVEKIVDDRVWIRLPHGDLGADSL